MAASDCVGAGWDVTAPDYSAADADADAALSGNAAPDAVAPFVGAAVADAAAPSGSGAVAAAVAVAGADCIEAGWDVTVTASDCSTAADAAVLGTHQAAALERRQHRGGSPLRSVTSSTHKKRV